jgi:hypothetical protein
MPGIPDTLPVWAKGINRRRESARRMLDWRFKLVGTFLIRIKKLNALNDEKSPLASRANPEANWGIHRFSWVVCWTRIRASSK